MRLAPQQPKLPRIEITEAEILADLLYPEPVPPALLPREGAR
jgi:hypothetical protein